MVTCLLHASCGAEYIHGRPFHTRNIKWAWGDICTYPRRTNSCPPLLPASFLRNPRSRLDSRPCSPAPVSILHFFQTTNSSYQTAWHCLTFVTEQCLFHIFISAVKGITLEHGSKLGVAQMAIAVPVHPVDTEGRCGHQECRMSPTVSGPIYLYIYIYHSISIYTILYLSSFLDLITCPTMPKEHVKDRGAWGISKHSWHQLHGSDPATTSALSAAKEARWRDWLRA